ncbi:membrane-bound lytic murein transglycosylase F [Dysgonomonas sp. PH5-45]|uniref:transglycosylase SLT domain-containing protein n=1 Tax=unclassified Dysgonomonas TaxID=2630389 RepID=UPI00247339CF|nr:MULTISPECIES: transglycosylase SLT domain-containing protein [unclassified Dysgonomonas]MDH6355205.1 membrane-bound lytic murein transglycosylase F [Dysgonomonas sp. PH5-45]MDH6388069.1 membrane-bound lytic murein transglycosylase F [Dysgonomonas sp. PH5-37]
MAHPLHIKYIIIWCTITVLALSGCKPQKKDVYDFDQIKASGQLTVITLNSSTSYFIYKDEPMGYDYDLCRDFCDHYGLSLNIKIAKNQTQLLEMLENGEGDLVAYGIPVQNSLKDSIIYCGLGQISHQVLVQSANKGDTLLRDVPDLIGKEVYVRHKTKYHTRLENLNAELGGGILIKDVEGDSITTEDLIAMVADGEIRYTVSDENIAKLNKTYFRNIDVSIPISFEQLSSWVVRKNTPKLANALDEWFSKNGNTPVYKSITKKYFELSKADLDDDISSSLTNPSIPKGHLSPFDDLFKKHAQNSDLDWRLLAAIAYHESNFKTNLSSWAGATGLMGLMPRTAVAMGIRSEDRTNPDLSIKAATKLLSKLEKSYASIHDPHERIKFVLAAYNAGGGHVSDAQALARKYGADPHVWENNVRKYINLKSKPEYYNDPVCKNGYFRSTETLNYVDKVLARWHKYQEQK